MFITMSKSALIMIVVFLGLGMVELIDHNEASAEPARPIRQPDPEARSQATLPEPAALLRSYESSLSAYGRMKGRWNVQLETSEPTSREKSPRSTAEWAVFRDHDRLKVIDTTVRENGPEVFEALRQGTQQIHVHSDGRVLGWLQPSTQVEFDLLGSSLCSPCYGIMDSKWIPEFLRTAKLSVQAETLEGRPLYRLRGLTMDAKIELWIDPSLDYAARRIRFDKRASEYDPTVRSRQFDVTRFRLEKGRHVVAEATMALTVGPQPVFSGMVVEKIVQGKRVKVHLPAKDENGNVIVYHNRSTWKIELRKLTSFQDGPTVTSSSHGRSPTTPELRYRATLVPSSCGRTAGSSRSPLLRRRSNRRP